ncbi:MAG: hypothetical protein F4X99_02380 [Gammaproteobacteria bacterium]|nr:hypothetical protein [Gammaproteobacteria bacterium]
MFEDYNRDRAIPRGPEHSVPPGNVRAEHLGELLAGSVSVSRNVEFSEPEHDLQIVYTGGDGRTVTCHKNGTSFAGDARRWSWAPGEVRSNDGTVRSVVRWQARTPGLGEGPLSLLHDGETGEVVWHSDPIGFNLTGRLSWVQRYNGHLQERLPAATWTLCPDFPFAEALGVDVNHAQTATDYGSLVAQDPGRRIRRPDLVSTEAAEKAVSLGTWIEKILAGWRDADGRALRSWSRTDVPASRGAFVFYAPLSAVWELDTPDLAKTADAHVHAAHRVSWIMDADGRGASLHWHIRGGGTMAAFGWPELLPEYDEAKERHPLAVKHDRLLSQALTKEFAELPVGSRFGADGTVRPPDGTHEEAGGKCAAVGLIRKEFASATWRSEGSTVEIVWSDGSGTRVWLDDLVAAMDGNARQEPEAALTAAEEIECLDTALERARSRIHELEETLAEVEALNAVLETVVKGSANR